MLTEADALGDRIVIMADGRVICAGSGPFLKNLFGVGYHLRLEKGRGFDVNRMTTFAQKYFSLPSVEQKTSSECILVIDRKDAARFSEFFGELDKNMDSLGVKSYGLTITTMDDVFLRSGEFFEAKKLSGNQQAKLPKSHKDPTSVESTLSVSYSSSATAVTSPMPKYTQLQGLSHGCQQFWGLMVKRWHYLTRSWKSILSLWLCCCYVLLTILASLGNSFNRENLDDKWFLEMNDLRNLAEGRTDMLKFKVRN